MTLSPRAKHALTASWPGSVFTILDGVVTLFTFGFYHTGFAFKWAARCARRNRKDRL